MGSAEQIACIGVRGGQGATLDGVLPKLTRAAMATALGDVLAEAQTSRGDGGEAIVTFARVAGLR